MSQTQFVQARLQSTQAGKCILQTMVERWYLPLRKQVLEMYHLHHDIDVVFSSWAEVVFHVALPLKLEHHLLYGQAFSADAAELVP